MAYELTIKKTATFQNPKLASLADEMGNAIMVAGSLAERTKILCARHLSTIDAEKLYENDGFESALDFCKKVMGMSQSNAYAYMQVGRAVNTGTVPTTDKDGNEFNFTQLRRLCSVNDKKVLYEAVNDGTFNASQSDKEMADVVEEVQPKKERKSPAEKRYTWELVGDGEETEDFSKTEIIALFAEREYQYLGELKSGDDIYLCAIDCAGYPVMYRRGTEVKKVVETK